MGLVNRDDINELNVIIISIPQLRGFWEYKETYNKILKEFDDLELRSKIDARSYETKKERKVKYELDLSKYTGEISSLTNTLGFMASDDPLRQETEDRLTVAKHGKWKAEKALRSNGLPALVLAETELTVTKNTLVLYADKLDELFGLMGAIRHISFDVEHETNGAIAKGDFVSVGQINAQGMGAGNLVGENGHYAYYNQVSNQSLIFRPADNTWLLWDGDILERYNSNRNGVIGGVWDSNTATIITGTITDGHEPVAVTDFIDTDVNNYTRFEVIASLV